MSIATGLRIGALSLLVLFGLTGSGQAAIEGGKIFAMVVKVEGKGTAKLRRAIGTEAVVGSQMEVYPGDRILTDDDSTVDLALTDGTIIRVGINSEFHLQEAQLKQKFIAWVFGLVQGTIRSLAEKSADHSSVKVRVNSPSGTMGIRGTEVILGYDPKTGQTSLYTLEGNASFGAPNCERAKTCVSVKTGTFSRVATKAPQATAPAKFQDKDLFGIAGSAEAGKAEPFRQRLVLLQGVGRANTALAAVMSEADVKKAIDEAQYNLQAQQDAMLNRTAEIRKAMYAAMAAGTYDQVLKIADNYETSRGKDSDVKDFSVINSGPIAVKRFALGLAIVESPAFKEDGADAKGTGEFKVLAKDSPALAKAASWADAAAKDPSSAPFVSINGEAKNGSDTGKAPGTNQLDGKELRPLTGTEKALLKDPAVQTAFNELAVTSQGIATSKTVECDALCALAKANTNPPPPQPTQQNRSRRNRRSRSNTGMEPCERYVTVCTYKKISGHSQKVCNQVCKSNNGDGSGSSPAN